MTPTPKVPTLNQVLAEMKLAISLVKVAEYDASQRSSARAQAMLTAMIAAKPK